MFFRTGLEEADSFELASKQSELCWRLQLVGGSGHFKPLCITLLNITQHCIPMHNNTWQCIELHNTYKKIPIIRPIPSITVINSIQEDVLVKCCSQSWSYTWTITWWLIYTFFQFFSLSFMYRNPRKRAMVNASRRRCIIDFVNSFWKGLFHLTRYATCLRQVRRI